ncbi:hypothetical protein [Nonomuraea dietziae]|uniref:hypothetical protein n=1 Tax=Nonomuraea dietziae TaxID=65515 RepID=UPI00341D430B
MDRARAVTILRAISGYQLSEGRWARCGSPFWAYLTRWPMASAAAIRARIALDPPAFMAPECRREARRA